MAGDRSTVLVVDDDAACRDLHELWLSEEYRVVTADNGEEALQHVAQSDIMLVDRQMPVMDGEALARRVHEGDHQCFVVMLSGVEPDFDIVDLPVDEYLTKPVARETVLDVVDTMLTRDVCRRLLQEFFSLAARKERLERRKRPTELAESDEYRRLTADLEAKRVAVREMLEELDGEWQNALLSTVTEDGPIEELVSS